MLLVEILNAREEKSKLVKKEEAAVSKKKNKDPANTWFTWEEIVEHDRKSSLWIVIWGKVYDLTDFLDIHPGGDLFIDGAGGDCTPMWESYHPVKMAKQGPNEKYWIGMVRDYWDFYAWDGEFYNTVKERVEKVVPKENRWYHWKMYWKTITVLFGYFIGMYLYMFINTWWAAVIFSFISAQVGVNIMHDGNHMAFS